MTNINFLKFQDNFLKFGYLILLTMSIATTKHNMSIVISFEIILYRFCKVNNVTTKIATEGIGKPMKYLLGVKEKITLNLANLIAPKTTNKQLTIAPNRP